MRHLWKYLMVLPVMLAVAGCGREEKPGYVPGSSQQEDGGGNQGTGTGDIDKPSPAADYSRLTAANHPRVVMTEDDLARIKSKLDAGTDAHLQKMHDIIMKRADSYVGAKDLVYQKVGKRLLDVSRAASERIISCAYAWRMTGEEKYAAQAEHDIQTVCAFSDWNAPTHFLDGGEMAHGVGIGYDWLYKYLSAETKRAAEKAIKDYAFHCALNRQWNLNFYTSQTNWNQVCNGGLVVAAFATYEVNKADAQQIIDKAVESNLVAMAGMYSPDGNYPEGYGYWGYGTSFECVMLAAMESCAGTDYDLPKVEGFRKTGKWILFMEGMGRRAFNYSDSAPSSTSSPALWYLAYKFNDPSLLYYEVQKLSDGRYTAGDIKYLPMAMTYASRFDLNAVPVPEDHLWRGNGVNPVVLVHGDWTFSDSDYFLGIKGGVGNYSHSHLDAGSFVYDAYGTRWSADYGLQSYSTIENVIAGMGGNFSDYSQNSLRWDVFRYNNFNHSTLTVNDLKHNPAGKVPVVSVTDEEAARGATLDLTPVLRDQVESATRTITVRNGGDLVVEDIVKAKYNLPAKVRWTMVTMAMPTLESDRIVLKGAKKTLYLKVASSGSKVTLKQWSTVGQSYDADNSGYYEVGFESNVTVNKTNTFTVILTPEP